jgi:hypothetical protein
MAANQGSGGQVRLRRGTETPYLSWPIEIHQVSLHDLQLTFEYGQVG